MKPYLLFAGPLSPQGGWRDFIDSFDTLEEALENVPLDAEWYHVVHEESIVNFG